jgi:3-deoxy-D-manno-octulosonic-acid transferase
VNPLYSAAWYAGMMIASPVIAGAAIAEKGDVRRRMWPRRSSHGRAIHWHGASAGEVRALAGFQRRVRWGDDPPENSLSATTRAGVDMWREVPNADARVIPADLPWLWTRFMPEPTELVILSETELWPGWISWCARRDVPVVVVSALLSDQTARWLSLVFRGRIPGRVHEGRTSVRPHRKCMCRDGLTSVLPGDEGCIPGRIYVCAQSDEHAERFVRLGVSGDRVVVTGSLKLSQSTPVVPGEMRVSMGLRETEPVIVAGSLRDGEIEPFLDMFEQVSREFADVRCILAPRKTGEVEHARQAMRERGIPFDMRSSGKWTSQVLLVDTMGELAALYACATVALVGGSWVDIGGHNPVEAAVYGVPVVYGPHMRQSGCDLLEQAGVAHRVGDWNCVRDLICETLNAACDGHSRATITLPDPAVETWNSLERWHLVPTGAYIE